MVDEDEGKCFENFIKQLESAASLWGQATGNGHRPRLFTASDALRAARAMSVRLTFGNGV